MKNILKLFLICVLLIQVFPAVALADQYSGGAGDGWVYFDSEYLVLGGAEVSISSAENQIFNTGLISKDAAAITITDISGGGITAGGGLKIIIPSSFGMQWQGIMFDDEAITDASNADFSVIAATISSASVLPASVVAGVTGDAAVSFTSINPIPSNGKIVVTFPANFVLNSQGSTSASSTTMDGSFSVGIVGQVITITRSAGSISAAGSHLITLTNIQNPTVSGPTGTYLVKTQTSSGYDIDVSGALAATTIVSAPTSRIALNSPDDMTAGGSRAAYTLTRYDQYDNLSTQGGETFNLATNSTGANALFYNDANASEAGNIITSITIPQGSSSGSFWYDDTRMGAWTITSELADEPITISDAINVRHTEPIARFATDITPGCQTGLCAV